MTIMQNDHSRGKDVKILDPFYQIFRQGEINAPQTTQARAITDEEIVETEVVYVASVVGYCRNDERRYC